jgi:hypothetical protein
MFVVGWCRMDLRDVGDNKRKGRLAEENGDELE